MPTPTYPAFNELLPDGTSVGPTVIAQINDNTNALRDGIEWGSQSGWNFSVVIGSGTNEQPDETLHTKGAEILKEALVWGTTGGADGNITQVTYSWSNDSGATFSPRLPFSVESMTYNTDGTILSTIWSV